MTLFRSEAKDNKPFQFMHCWNILKHHPKWHERQNQLADPKQPSNKKPKANVDSTPQTSTPIDVDRTNNDISNKGAPETEAPKRPMGKKKAKEALRRGGSGACVDALDNLWEKKRILMQRKNKRKRRDINKHMH
ncbi:hypothetical protein ACP70R_044769 [Stipagrostis hirtigluma subsp. patula]